MLRFHLDPDLEPASRRQAFLERSVAWLVARFGIGPGTRLVDLGCGPGLYTNALARHGATVTGVDFSSRSLAHAEAEARRDGLEIAYVEADYLRWEPTAPAELVTLIYCDLCAQSAPQRRRLLDTVRACLAPGGHFLLDVCAMPAEARLDDGFWAPGDYVGIQARHRYEAAAPQFAAVAVSM